MTPSKTPTPAPPAEQHLRGTISQVNGSEVFATLGPPYAEVQHGPLVLEFGTDPFVGEDCLIWFDVDQVGYVWVWEKVADDTD